MKKIQPDVFLLSKKDIKLPVRTNLDAHKGCYGHTTVFAGEKSGAAILAATAALNFGSGLTTVYACESSNLANFQISPELMISREIPAKTNCVVIGSGISKLSDSDFQKFSLWFNSAKAPAVVFDAGMFSMREFPRLLNELNQNPDARIVLTPHLLEFSRFLENVRKSDITKTSGAVCKTSSNAPEGKLYVTENIINASNALEPYTLETLVNSEEARIQTGRFINQLFPRTAVIIKSSGTFIATQNKTFICRSKNPALAKGGTGDVLTGLTAALLAQNYSLSDACITAVLTHSLAARKFPHANYALTPLKLIDLVGRL